MSFGRRLKDAREAAGYTQRGFAKACGWESESQSRISQYENNKREPTLAEIVKMAEVAGVDPVSLAFDAPQLKRDETKILQAYRNATEEGRGFIESAADQANAHRGKRRGSA